jgi:DNA-3-methyladenine glycosylase II
VPSVPRSRAVASPGAAARSVTAAASAAGDVSADGRIDRVAGAPAGTTGGASDDTPGDTLRPPAAAPRAAPGPGPAAPSTAVVPVVRALAKPVPVAPPGTCPSWWHEGGAALSAADPVLASVIRAWQGKGHLSSRGDPFTTLARSIVGQQISVKAAQAVWLRFEKAAGTVVPERVARMRLATMTRAGLSTRKAEYVRDLATRFVSGAVDPQHWPSLDDEAVIAELVQVRGIGRWTAEMFLIFNLLRPDVFPIDDLGLIKGISVNYREGRPVSKAEAAEMGSRWQPWRTVATWYLWRSLDPLPVEY